MGGGHKSERNEEESRERREERENHRSRITTARAELTPLLAACLNFYNSSTPPLSAPPSKIVNVRASKRERRGRCD